MTKRKTAEEKAARKPRKRVAFLAPGTVATKALIARNASSSPLFRLPLEVRNKIWREVLGDRLIHLEYSYDDGLNFEDNEDMHASMHYSTDLHQMYGSAWRHLVCEDDGPENRENTRIPGSGSGWHLDNYLYLRPHVSCAIEYSLLPPGTPIDFYDHETMRLTILRSCRQGYVEANQILWTTNTFSFSCAMAFKRFMMTRNIHQKRMIRSLRLEMEFGIYGNTKGWNSALNLPLIRSLSGLRHLRLRIDYELEDELYNTLKRMDMFYATTYCDGLQKLSTLPLTEVEIAVKDPLSMSETLWKKADRVAYAAGLRELLLDPQGAEIYAAARLKEKELMRRERELEAEFRASMSRPRLLAASSTS